MPVSNEVNIINRIRDILIEPLSEDDFDSVLDLERESFTAEDRLDRESLEEFYRGFREGIFKIISGGNFTGYFLLLVNDGDGYIESIAIGKRYRNQGYGLLALKYILNKFDDMGIKKISLHVRTDNRAAIELYEKEGFFRDGVAEGFYTDGKPAYVYTRTL